MSGVDSDGHCYPFCDVISWAAIHFAKTGTGIQKSRVAYNKAADGSLTEGGRDFQKFVYRKETPALGTALAENAAKDPMRVAARNAKTDAQLAESVSRTSSAANAAADWFGKAGRIAGGVAAAAAVVDVASAPEGEKVRTAVGDAGGLAGAIAGGEWGATVGGALGSLFPGAGNVAGAFVGGVIGAIGGGWGGERVATDLYDTAMESEEPPKEDTRPQDTPKQ